MLGLLLLGGLLRGRADAAPLARRVLLAGLGVVLMAVVVVPWTVRNQQTFHQFVPVSNNLGTALAGANCRLTYSGPSLGSWRSTFGEGDAGAGQCFTGFNGSQPGFNEARAAGDARHQGITYARDHLGDLPKVAVTRVLRTFGVFRPEQQVRLEALEGRPLGWERAGTWFEWVLYPLAVAGAVLLVRRKAPVWPLAAAVLSVLVSTLVTYGNQRFRIGAEPAILVAAATAVVADRRVGPAHRDARRPPVGSPAHVLVGRPRRVRPRGGRRRPYRWRDLGLRRLVPRRHAPAPPPRRRAGVRRASAPGSGCATAPTRTGRPSAGR